MPVLRIRYTDLKLTAERCGVQTPVGQEHFLFSLSVQNGLWCPPSLPCGTVAFYQGSRGVGLLSSHCPPSVEFKERVELHLYFRYMSAWPVTGRQLHLPCSSLHENEPSSTPQG